ncbi:interferon-induced, double-stranded RNA-activated protein kinase-like [Saccostrea cucullata]|uniref:interferon-induced, double-stranded RNA-activated protein kinase-like n=1 Tax=Saccostrea cuccullata TaxID=36930 RepID=UPI002ED378CA
MSFKSSLSAASFLAVDSGLGNGTDSSTGSLDLQCIRNCLKDPIITRKYQDIEILDGGGFGIVYSAKLKVGGGKRALKAIPVHNKNYEKAIREVESLETLKHDNIVRFYDCFLAEYEESDGTVDDDGGVEFEKEEDDEAISCISKDTCLIIVTELCTQNLKSLLLSGEKFDKKMISLNILDGLQAIHAQNIIHRDLKPSNVLIGTNGEAKIGDFGLSRFFEIILDDDEHSSGKKTLSGNCGTPLYQAPEMKLNGTYDKRVDYFSLGVVFFELFLNIKTAMEIEKLIESFKQLETAKSKIHDEIIDNENNKAHLEVLKHIPEKIGETIQGLLKHEATSRIDLERAKILLTEVTSEEIEELSTKLKKDQQ